MLKYSSLGLLNGAYYPPELIASLSKSFTIQYARNAEQLFKMLAGHRFQVILADSRTGQHVMQKVNSRAITMSPEPFHQPSLHCIGSKNNPRALSLVETFNTGMVTIKNNGEYNKILLSHKMKADQFTPMFVGRSSY